MFWSIFNYLKHNIKLAFKSVTYHFKHYFCFYAAVLIVEAMFGIIVMSSSNNIYQFEENTKDDYDYHFAIVGLTSDARKHFINNQSLSSDVNFYVYDEPMGSYFNVNVYLDTEAEGRSLSELFKIFNQKYMNVKDVEFEIAETPLFSMGSQVMQMRIECILKLLVLAIVSILVIMLLYNIRINHFKFTYGIYMSFGADTKQLFTTCVWEIAMISVLTLIPSGIISTVVSFLYYELADYEYHFAPQLQLLCVLFMVPIIMIAIYLPIKSVATKPPLKLLLAEDNSNLVTPPRISVKMLGKRFTRWYELIGIARFRRYIATLVLSSVVFSSLFVCISFFQDIYDFNNKTEKQEYTVHFNQKEIKEEVYMITENSKDFYEPFLVARAKAYGKDYAESKMVRVRKFESYYVSEDYTIERDKEGNIFNVIDKKDKKSVLEDYISAKTAVISDDCTESDFATLEEYLNDVVYARLYDENGNFYSLMKMELVERIRYDGEELTPERELQLANLDNGIKWIYKQCSISAFKTQSHVLFDSSDTKLMGEFVINPHNKEEKALNTVEYFAAGRDAITYIADNYTYEGDLYDVFYKGPKGEKYVIISETAANSKILNIDVGDTIKLAKFIDIAENRIKNATGKHYLSAMVEYGQFEYETYTVCAIIKDMPTSDNLPIYLDPADFTRLTGKEEVYTDVAVYVNSELESGDITTLTETLRRWCSDFAKVEWHNAIAESRLEIESRNIEVIQTISYITLFLAPLFWFFSQIMYYQKREKEFELIRGMGAIEKEVKKTFIVDGLVISAIGAVSTTLFSFAGIWLIHQINMKFISRINLSSRVLYSFELPLTQLLIAIAVTIVSAFLASYIPYRINKKASSLSVAKEYDAD